LTEPSDEDRERVVVATAGCGVGEEMNARC
jgi:hypothetical protein